MLTKRGHETDQKRNEVTIICLESMVPPNHLVRKIDAIMNWDFIYKKVDHLYCKDNGRPSIDPVILVKISMIQLIFGIPSMRQTLAEIETNLAYRWFLGYGINEEIPHHSTVGKNFLHRFEENEIAQEIFQYVLKQCISHNLVDNNTFFIDSTHVKASANKNKHEEKEELIPPKPYHEVLKNKIDQVRQAHGKKPF